MASPEQPKLSIAFTWNDELGENEYVTGANVPQPVTREGIEQAAVNVAGIIAKLLEMEGIIQPPAVPRADADRGPGGDVA